MSRAGGGAAGGQGSGRFAGRKSSYGALISTAGDHLVVTPDVDKRLTIYWVSFIPSSDNAGANLVTVHFEDAVDNLYCSYAAAHWEPFTGLLGKSLIINTATIEPVAVTVHYKEHP